MSLNKGTLSQALTHSKSISIYFTKYKSSIDDVLDRDYPVS